MCCDPCHERTHAEHDDAEGEMESTALHAATRGLEDCLQDWNHPGRGRLDDALRYNLRLWTLFECDLSQPRHGFLPRLRVDLLLCCALVDRRTFEIIAQPTSEGLRSLIEINRRIPAGPLPPEDRPRAATRPTSSRRSGTR